MGFIQKNKVMGSQWSFFWSTEPWHLTYLLDQDDTSKFTQRCWVGHWWSSSWHVRFGRCAWELIKILSGLYPVQIFHDADNGLKFKIAKGHIRSNIDSRSAKCSNYYGRSTKNYPIHLHHNTLWLTRGHKFKLPCFSFLWKMSSMRARNKNIMRTQIILPHRHKMQV